MEKVETVRCLTLFLEGGHTIKLGGAMDVTHIVQYVQNGPSSLDVLDFTSGTGERLFLRPGALLGFVDSYYGGIDRSNAEEFPVKPYIIIRDFLSNENHQRLIERALAREEDFKSSEVTTGVENYRKSSVLDEDAVISDILSNALNEVIHDVAKNLNLLVTRDLSASEVECQLTASKNEDFFLVHSDSGSRETESRVMTYVYYFRTRVHSFFGGELKLYPPVIDNGLDITGRDSFTIPPDDNSIVFFASDIKHEVLPTYVPSRLFSDSRFTVNGWLNRSVRL